MERLSLYRLDEMIPVGMEVREALDCNWKVVMDAFLEDYHIIVVHPELLSVIDLEAGNSQHGFFGDHGMAVSPFEVKRTGDCSLEQQVKISATSRAPVRPSRRCFRASKRWWTIAGRRPAKFPCPKAVPFVPLLQRATLTAKGLDVSGLSDDQMSDNQGWFLFPNFFMTIRAGEATTIMAWPHPDGDANKCIWHVTAYMWLPQAMHGEYRAAAVKVTESGSYPYFLALQQDYEQIPRQQQGLRNTGLGHLSLLNEELSIARFHAVLDRYLAGLQTVVKYEHDNV